MRGRQVLMQTLVNHGVDRIFGNPGTTESPLLDSLLDYPSIQYIVHLHEGVAVGAANFYAQASGKTAFVNLHVAPGLGNAIGMIYGALKNNSPMVVTAGQQDTRARLRDPVLGHDLAAMAAPVTKWSVQVETRRRARPDPAARLQDRQRGAGRSGVRGTADQRDGAGDRHSSRQAGDDVHGEPARSGRHRRRGQASAAAKNPAIVAGDDVARAGAVETLVKLAEKARRGGVVRGPARHAIPSRPIIRA